MVVEQSLSHPHEIHGQITDPSELPVTDSDKVPVYDSSSCAYYESGTITCVSDPSELTGEDSEAVNDEKSAYARLLQMYTHDGRRVYVCMYVYIHMTVSCYYVL
jgi:hypothetical protein